MPTGPMAGRPFYSHPHERTHIMEPMTCAHCGENALTDPAFVHLAAHGNSYMESPLRCPTCKAEAFTQDDIAQYTEAHGTPMVQPTGISDIELEIMMAHYEPAENRARKRENDRAHNKRTAAQRRRR